MITAVLLMLLGAFLTVVGFLVWAVVSSSAEEATAYRIGREQQRAEQRIYQITQDAVQQMLDVTKEGS